TYKGLYSTFTDSPVPHQRHGRRRSVENDVPFQVQRFDKAVYTDDVQTPSITNSKEAAEFTTGARYSTGNKTMALFLGHDKTINGAVQLTDLSRKGIADRM